MLQVKATLSVADIERGDHIMEDNQHWVVQSKTSSDFTGYTISKRKMVKSTKKWNQNIRCIVYPQQYRIDTEEVLKIAEQEITQKQTKDKSLQLESCDEFVTRIKCGTKYSIDKSCLISHDARPVGCSRITSDTNVLEGDHLLVKNGEEFASVVVCALNSRNSITILPDINGQFQVVINPEDEIYRVNYSEQLHPCAIVKRAQNSIDRVDENQQFDCHNFVTNAVLGKEIPISADELLRNQQIKLVTPTHYKCVISLDEIKPGDHLFTPYPGYRWHFMVTDCKVDGNPDSFQVIYCLRGVVQEKVEKLDPLNRNLFKVFYTEQLPTEKAIQRAQSKIGHFQHGMLKRLEFVPWAKTGSEEGLEIDLMTNISAPISKDSIVTFTQLNPGDYLVVEINKFEVYHHYLVLSVESVTSCTAMESWKHASPKKVKIDIKNGINFYRINFNRGVCRSAQESIKIATDICEKGWRLFNSFSRRAFVNFLKTGDFTNEVTVDALSDRRLQLPREKITSAMQLKKGDHLERLIGFPANKLPMLSSRKHHMIVFKPINDMECDVIEAEPKHGLIKGQPTTKRIKVFDKDVEIYRVMYSERIHPDEGIALCLKVCYIIVMH